MAIRTHRWASRIVGFSLVELMIALVASLVVVGAVLAFAVSVLQSNSQNIAATRLMQELRTSIDYMARELRRAGYDQNAVRIVSNATGYASPFRGISVSDSVGTNDCIIYGYDRAGGTPGTVDSGEVFGVRRTTVASGAGVIEVHRGGSAAPTCGGSSASAADCFSGTAGWCPLTDSRVVDVTALNFTRANTDTAGSPAIRVRVIDIDIQGRLVNATDTIRRVENRVRVRADCVAPTAAGLSACSTAPVQPAPSP